MAAFAGGAEGGALRSTAGATADCVAGVVGAAGFAAGAAGGAGGRVVAVRVVTVRLAVVAGFGAATLAVRTVRTVLVFVVVVADDAEASRVTVALGSGVTGGVSVVVTGEASTAGGGLGVATGAGSVGCTAWASKGVEESARAAAIAGRARVRASCWVLVIIKDNHACGSRSHDYRSAEP